MNEKIKLGDSVEPVKLLLKAQFVLGLHSWHSASNFGCIIITRQSHWLLNPGFAKLRITPCICKQCRSRAVGF